MPLLLRSRSTPSVAAAGSVVSVLGSLSSRVGPAQLAVARTSAGVVMIARPRALPGLLGVDSATSARMSWALQMLGAREIALGVGTLVALRSGKGAAARTWVAAGVLCDTVDALVVGVGLARRRLPVASGATTLAVAAGAVASGVRELQSGG